MGYGSTRAEEGPGGSTPRVLSTTPDLWQPVIPARRGGIQALLLDRGLALLAGRTRSELDCVQFHCFYANMPRV